MEGWDARTIYWLGYHGLLWEGYTEEANRIADLLLEYLPTLPPETQLSNSYRNQKGWFLFGTGEVEEAERIFKGLVDDNPDNLNYRTAQAIMAANLGDTATARATLRWLEQFEHSYERGGGLDLRAPIEAHFGNHDEAVRLLELAVRRGPWMVWSRYPPYRPLWDHPGFKEIMKPKG